MFQGISPHEQIFGTILGLLQREPYLLGFNPALYVANGSRHQVYGYAVVTYTLNLWAP